MSFLFPKMTVRSYHELDIQHLKDSGVRLLFVDVDNTITTEAHDGSVLPHLPAPLFSAVNGSCRRVLRAPSSSVYSFAAVLLLSSRFRIS